MPRQSTSGDEAPNIWRSFSARLKSRPFKTGRVALVAQGLLVAAIVCVSVGATDQAARFDKVGSHLMCTCGCAQSLLGCDHVGCPSRGAEMDQLRQGIASGKSDAAILDSFVADYGAVVLSAPTTKGFDLLAWIMPFAVSAVALIGTIFLVRHWAKNQPRLAPVRPPAPKAEEEMRERIRRETGTE
jgi:cytochrome c-type biogenesis protein CcmH